MNFLEKMKDAAQQWAMKKLSNEVLKQIVCERVRIWNELHKFGSVAVYQDGNKTSQVFSMGIPKMQEIIMPELPEDFEGFPEGSKLEPEQKKLPV